MDTTGFDYAELWMDEGRGDAAFADDDATGVADEAGEADDAGEQALDEAAVRARRELLSVVDWKKTMPQLEEFATARARGERTAGEVLAADAVANAYDPLYVAWDPAKEDVLRYLQSMVNGALANERRRDARRQTTGAVDVDAVLAHGARTPSIEAMATLRELIDRCAVQVETRFGAQGLAFLRVVADTPDEQCTALGMSEKEAYRLKRNVLEFCRRSETDAKSILAMVGAGVIGRVPVDEELPKLEEAINAMLPHVQVQREAERREAERKEAVRKAIARAVLIGVGVGVLLLAFIAYAVLSGGLR
jgi:hypothetical protein